MGGYGATRIGMKHADVFGSLYIMSPCCLSPRGSGGGRGAPGGSAANDSAKLPFGLRRYRALAIDVGDQDGLRVDAGKLHDVLDQYGIANTFEIYPGTHTSDVAVRFQEHVMPFFSRTLSFEPAKR
jgi:S-formylglutathione hydrolase FrmB